MEATGRTTDHRVLRREGALVALVLVSALAATAPVAAHPAVVDDAPDAHTLGLPVREGPPSETSSAEAATAEGSYAVRFTCPALANGGLFRPEALCPLYVLDQHDVMGQPVLLVDPLRPDQLAFNALHGGRGVHALPGSEPPTERARDNDVHQPHTTFRTTDGGTTWEDMPYYAPDGLAGEDRKVFGIDNAAALDADGRLVLASLYAYADEPTTSALALSLEEAEYAYAIGLWKAGRVEAGIDYHAGVAVVDLARDEPVEVSAVHALAVPALHRTVVLWHERVDGAGTVRAVTSEDGRGATWDELVLTGAPGPCDDVSSPVVQGTDVVFACVPGEGYRFPPNATAGLQLHAIDVETGSVRHHSSPGLAGGDPVLVARGPHGHLVALTTELDDQGTPHVHLAYGDPLGRWGGQVDIGEQASLAPASVPVTLARVTAAAYRPDSGTLHILYMERSDAGEAGQVEPAYTKTLVVVKAEGDVLAVQDLEVGRVSRSDATAVASDAGLDALEDLHDSIVVWQHPRNGGLREFVAFADNGFVRFAEVVEDNAAPPLVALAPGVPAVPVASAGVAPVLVGAGAAVLSSAMVLHMLRSRRETPAAVEAEK